MKMAGFWTHVQVLTKVSKEVGLFVTDEALIGVNAADGQKNWKDDYPHLLRRMTHRTHRWEHLVDHTYFEVESFVKEFTDELRLRDSFVISVLIHNLTDLLWDGGFMPYYERSRKNLNSEWITTFNSLTNGIVEGAKNEVIPKYRYPAYAYIEERLREKDPYLVDRMMQVDFDYLVLKNEKVLKYFPPNVGKYVKIDLDNSMKWKGREEIPYVEFEEYMEYMVNAITTMLTDIFNEVDKL